MSEECANCESLKHRLEQLESKLAFFSTHATLARGMAGESLVAKSVNGTLTSHTSPFDIKLIGGATVEVKTSMLGDRRRWAWEKIFGTNNNKNYDYLILLGEALPEMRHHYSDHKSPFACFVIPFSEVLPLCTKGINGALKIQLSIDPRIAKATSRTLFSQYQVSVDSISNSLTEVSEIVVNPGALNR